MMSEFINEYFRTKPRYLSESYDSHSHLPYRSAVNNLPLCPRLFSNLDLLRTIWAHSRQPSLNTKVIAILFVSESPMNPTSTFPTLCGPLCIALTTKKHA